MKSDLEKLLITETQFQQITGILVEDLNDILLYKDKLFSQRLSKLIVNFWLYFATYFLASALVLFPIVWIVIQILAMLFSEFQFYGFWWLLRISAYLGLPISLFFSVKLNYKKFMKLNAKKNEFNHLLVLFNEFKKHNQIVKAIDVKEQLEAVEKTTSDPQTKSTLLKALIEMREDLIKALKVEKILRENRTVVATNPELFKSSFDSTNVQKIIDRGSEYDRLVNKTLKIGTEVNKQMKKMKDTSERN